MEASKLIQLNDDLRKLDAEYTIEIHSGYILVRNIPYVNTSKQIFQDGVLVSALTLAGERTQRPSDHICLFQAQSFPCTKDGIPISAIQHQNYNPSYTVFSNFQVQFSFSNKPLNGYVDYYHKMSTYINIIANEAQSINSELSAQKKEPSNLLNQFDPPFKYEDTNSSRSEVASISDKFLNQRIAIIGLGGTGSYILDFVAKTKVKEIHLFDDDTMQNHNAFRTPGAVPIQTLNNNPSKVSYLRDMYSHIKNGIYIYEQQMNKAEMEHIIEEKNIKFDFVFVCIDKNKVKKELFSVLIKHSIPFIDVGIGVSKLDNGALLGSARITLGNNQTLNDINKFISFEDSNEENMYAEPNIQIAEVNALNATLAVIRWKKENGFYSSKLNGKRENHSVYDLQNNKIINEL